MNTQQPATTSILRMERVISKAARKMDDTLETADRYNDIFGQFLDAVVPDNDMPEEI